MASLQDTRQRLRAVVVSCFPADARVVDIPRQADLVLAISWPLRSDPLRPSKRSKVVRISVADEVLDLYLIGSAQEKRDTDNLISVSIRGRLAKFEADHDRGAGEEPEVVMWHISS